MFRFFKRKSQVKECDDIRGKSTSEEMVIPKDMDFVGGQLFEETGQEFLNYFIDFCKLDTNAQVLDVGCGIGRMAIPLTQYLSKESKYVGFDIVPEGIDWCKQNISTRYPHFQFERADIYNKLYNPHGKNKSSTYQFPYPDSNFDFVFLTSVFTHLLPIDLENYFSEVTRVLKPDGKTLITWFLLNPESEELIKNGQSHLNIRHEYQSIKIADLNMPEAATGYNESHVKTLYKQLGLTIELPILYGGWCGRRDFTSYQDIIVAHK